MNGGNSTEIKYPFEAKTISEQEDIPRKYIEQLITVLKRGGLVGSLSGPHGGYVLVKSPSEISMKDVVLALEGTMLPVECHEHPEYVPHCSDCITRQIWQELQIAILGTLEEVTLAELLE